MSNIPWFEPVGPENSYYVNDRNELCCDIYIKPIRAIEFIEFTMSLHSKCILNPELFEWEGE